MIFNEGDSLEGLAMRSSGAATGTRSPMPARSTSTTTGPTTRTTTSASADPRKSRSDDGIAVGELTLGRESPGEPTPKARQHAKPGTATGATVDVAEHGDNSLQAELIRWAISEGVVSANHLAKIRDELEELEAKPSDPMEMADILLALMLHAEQNGVDLIATAHKKLAIVKTRTYGKPDSRGVVRHISP